MVVEAGKPINIFCAYAKEDRTLCEELKKWLDSLHTDVEIKLWYDREISPGTEWRREIDIHLGTASIILLLISTDFLASDYCNEEMTRAIERQKAKKAHIIPIILRPCDWESSPIGNLQVLPGSGYAITKWTNKDEAYLNITHGIRRTITDLITISAEEASRQHLWHVPARDSLFTDRDAILSRLHNALKVDSAQSIQALTGLAGIGKTDIAVEYAYRYRQDYSHIFWMNAKTRKRLTADFLELANFLHLRESTAQNAAATIAAVKHWLEMEKNWLLIWDDANDLAQISDLLPTSGTGHIILTACGLPAEKSIGRVRVRRTRVDKMEPEDATLFLLRKTHAVLSNAPLEAFPPIDRELAKKIVDIVDGHPLALDEAGSYIEETGDGLAGFLQLSPKRSRDLLIGQSRTIFLCSRIVSRLNGGRRASDHRPSIATIFKPQLQKVRNTNRAAAELLTLLAFLSPDDIPGESSDSIPEEILREGLAPGNNLKAVSGKPTEPDNHDEAHLNLNDAIKVLLTYSLVHRDIKENALAIHCLLQATLKNDMRKQTKRTWAERAVRAVNHIFPQHISADKWQLCERYLRQAKVCAALINQYNLAFSEAGFLLYRVAFYLHQCVRYKEAEQFYLDALKTYTKIPGAIGHDRGIVLSELANLLCEQGRYEEAEQFYQEALDIVKQKLGTDHLVTGAIYNNFGRLYHTMGRFQQAQSLYQKALTIVEEVLGQDHPYFINIKNNLKLLQQAQKQYEQTTFSELLVSPQTSSPQTTTSYPVTSREQDQDIQYGPIYEFEPTTDKKIFDSQNTTKANGSEYIFLEQMEPFFKEEEEGQREE